jgi:hypothetical protein
MEWQIPVNTLFTQVFGIAQPLIRKFQVNTEEGEPVRPSYKLELIEEEEEEDFIKSSLGTPVQFAMGFKGGSEFNYFLNGEIKKKPMDECWLPFTSLATFSHAKRLTETYMSGHDDSVIEQYGFEPWSIKIQGFLIKGEKSLTGDSGLASIADQVRKLNEWKNLADSISVKGKAFEWNGIHKVAIVNITWPAARDLDMNVIKPFEISLRSVTPIELIEI